MPYDDEILPDTNFENGETPGPGLDKILPALGLGAIEKDNRAIQVINADDSTGDDLAEAFGQEQTLLVDGDEFNPDHVTHQIDVLSRTGPVRVVLSRLDELPRELHYELEKLLNPKNDYPVKSFWLIDPGKGIDRNLRVKVFMQCETLVDAATLLDAIAFGWGSQNPYDGQPVGGEVDMYGHDKDVIPSEKPLFDKPTGYSL